MKPKPLDLSSAAWNLVLHLLDGSYFRLQPLDLKETHAC